MHIVPLFRPIYHGKAINRELTDMVVRCLIRDSAQKAGFDRSIALAFSGHSMRVGAVVSKP